MSMSSAWSLFGLTVRSQLPLPFAAMQDDGGSEPDVSVRFGTLPAGSGGLEACGPEAIQFEASGAGRFRVSGGREIVIDPAPCASERNLRLYLLGSAFGALLHQRGVLPLHANAVLIDGRAVAFMGRSGAGKSTLAAWFQDRGHVVLADDVCAVTVEGGTPCALPGVPRLRLWKDALERSGRDADDFDLSFDGRDKFDVPSPRARVAVAAPLAALYLLEEHGEAHASIEPLGAGQAVEALIAHTYRGRCVPLIGASARHFAACLELARHVPAHLVRRRKETATFERTAQALESHARALLAPSAPAVCT
jgi:hypothetical protein